MKKILVDLSFKGTAEILVPDHLSDADAKLLAEKIALAKVVATFDNPDAPEDDACEDYANETESPTADQDWDASKAEGIGGSWQVVKCY